LDDTNKLNKIRFHQLDTDLEKLKIKCVNFFRSSSSRRESQSERHKSSSSSSSSRSHRKDDKYRSRSSSHRKNEDSNNLYYFTTEQTLELIRDRAYLDEVMIRLEVDNGDCDSLLSESDGDDSPVESFTYNLEIEHNEAVSVGGILGIAFPEIEADETDVSSYFYSIWCIFYIYFLEPYDGGDQC